MANQFGFHIIDMKSIQDRIRQSLSTEDEPYEGEINIKDVEKEIVQFINKTKAESEGRTKFIFDSYVHQSCDAVIEFLEKLGKPQFVICLNANDKTI